MDEAAGQVWQEFKDFSRPNDSNAARHAIIDAQLNMELAADPDATVLILGAGFDTRAFRLSGGRWIEVDEPAIIEGMARHAAEIAVIAGSTDEATFANTIEAMDKAGSMLTVFRTCSAP